MGATSGFCYDNHSASIYCPGTYRQQGELRNGVNRERTAVRCSCMSHNHLGHALPIVAREKSRYGENPQWNARNTCASSDRPETESRKTILRAKLGEDSVESVPDCG